MTVENGTFDCPRCGKGAKWTRSHGCRCPGPSASCDGCGHHFSLPAERTNSRPAKRQLSFIGLPINVEIEAGDVKSGIGEDGQAWSHQYEIPYGEIDSTLALSDGDPVDVYLGPGVEDMTQPFDTVFVVHQLKKDGGFDEDKVMLGFPNADSAADAYRKHGPPWGFGSMDAMTLDQFVNGYLAANREHQDAHSTAASREAAGQERFGS